MEEDLRAQEAFYQSGESPSATVVKANPKLNNSISENALHSILSPVKEIKERQIVREKNVMETTSQNKGFPVAEHIDVW